MSGAHLAGSSAGGGRELGLGLKGYTTLWVVKGVANNNQAPTILGLGAKDGCMGADPLASMTPIWHH